LGDAVSDSNHSCERAASGPSGGCTKNFSREFKNLYDGGGGAVEGAVDWADAFAVGEWSHGSLT